MPCLTISVICRPVGGSHALPREMIASPCEILLLQTEEAADQLGHAIYHVARRWGHRSIAGLQPGNHCGDLVRLPGPSLAQLAAERVAGGLGPGEPPLADLQLPLFGCF